MLITGLTQRSDPIDDGREFLRARFAEFERALAATGWTRDLPLYRATNLAS